MQTVKKVQSSTVYDAQSFDESPFQSVVYASASDYLKDLLIVSQGLLTDPLYAEAVDKIEQHERARGTTLDLQLTISEIRANH